MMKNEQFNKSSHGPQTFPSQELSLNSIAVYTILTILNRMHAELGLEVMLEYLNHYLKKIEKSNPAIKDSVTKVLTMMSIEKIYEDALR